MKTLITSFALTFVLCFANYSFAQAPIICCPDFTVKILGDDCDTSKDHIDPSGGAGSNQPRGESLCQNGTYTFFATPNILGFTYDWYVTGGTPATFTGNPITITWGTGTVGTITLVVHNADSSCAKGFKDTSITLRPGPKAAFTLPLNQHTFCVGQSILFTNTSVGGTSCSWDFGDGSPTITSPWSPSHTYTSPSSPYYVVTLTVTSTPPTKGGGTFPPPPCPCTSIFRDTVYIKAGPSLSISDTGCKKMFCVGDTGHYCSNIICTTGSPHYSWTVVGGTIIQSGTSTLVSATASCIDVIWTPASGSPQPTVLLTVDPSCVTTGCSNKALLIVPILYDGIPITGQTTVCVNSTSIYSLPTLPGTFMHWSITPGGNTIVTADSNNEQIGIAWQTVGTYTIECDYSNPITKCSGKTKLVVTVLPRFKILGPTQSCVGCSSNYATADGSSASWVITPFVQNFPNGSNISVPWTLPNTYTVTATTTGAYCNSSSSITVTVAPRPVLTNLIGRDTICPSATEIYSVTSNTQGIPIQWTVTPSCAIVMSGTDHDSAQITFPAGSGPYTITASQDCLFKCGAPTTITKVVYVVPAPGTIIGPSNTCMDITIPYSINNAATGIAYTWTISPPAAGTIVSGQGTGTANVVWHGGSPTATLTVTNCSGSSSKNVTITAPPPFSVTRSGSLCVSPGVTLTATPGGSNYVWTGPMGGNNSTLVTLLPGTYTVTAIMNGCPVTANFTILPATLSVKIFADKLFYCVGQTISTNFYSVVNSSEPGPITYQWNPPILGTNPTAVSNATGTFTLTVTQGTCNKTSNSITITQIPCPVDTGCPSDLGTLVTSSVHQGTSCNIINFSSTFTLGNGSYTFLPPIQWNFGDLGTGSGPNPSHTYTNIGVYHVVATASVQVSASPLKICTVISDLYVTIPAVAGFSIMGPCGVLQLQDTSQIMAPNTLISRTWSVTPGGALLSSTSLPNPTLTGTPGNYNVTLTIVTTSCTSTITLPVVIPALGVPNMTITNPRCVGKPVFYSTSTVGVSYTWTFGDSFFSHLQAPEHAYAVAGPQWVTLTVIDMNGCILKDSIKITINPVPVCTLTPISICPHTSGTLVANLVPSCPGCTYSWNEIGGGSNPIGTLSSVSVNHFGHYFVTVTDPSTGCSSNSDTVLVTMKQAPIAKITGSSTICYSGSPTPFVLSNQVLEPNCTYNWSSSNGAVITFSPTSSSTQEWTYVTLTNPTSPPYQIFLSVTNSVTGCTSFDTLCIYPYAKPYAYINGGGCEGIPNVLTAGVSPAGTYFYLWNTGETTQSITTSVAGVYSVTITNTLTGCSAQATAQIKPLPDLTLWPLGCATVCNTDTIKVPLPIISASQSINNYNIKWEEWNGANWVQIGPVNPTGAWQLYANTLSLGLHHIHIVVTGPTGSPCIATSGTFDVTIIACNCDCNKHKLTNISYSIGTTKKFTPIECGMKLHDIKCDSITIKANFVCDSGCKATIIGVLIGPGGNVIQTWNPMSVMGAVIIPTPGMNGIYTFHLYGKCGDKICDSCMFSIPIDCPHTVDSGCIMCPPELKKAINIQVKPHPLVLVPIGSNQFNQLPVDITVSAGSVPLTQFSAQVVGYQLNPSYTDCITCDNKPAGWVSLVDTGKLAGIKPVNVGLTQFQNFADYRYMSPREVVWQSQIPFTLNPGNTTLNLYLPSLAKVPCCTLSGTICIRFTFRDINCKVCDTVICFPFNADTSCSCGSWQGVIFNIGGGIVPKSTRIECGGSYSLAANTPFDFGSLYQCAGGNCTAQYNWVLSDMKGNTISSGNSTSGIIPKGIAGGSYILTYTVSCGGKKCDGCKIKILVKDAPPKDNGLFEKG